MYPTHSFEGRGCFLPSPINYCMNHIPTCPKRSITSHISKWHMISGFTIKGVLLQRTGSADCGLFALASATALAHGKEPGSLVFERKEMRPHLIKCLEAGEAESFPVRKSRRMLKKIKATYTVPIYRTAGKFGGDFNLAIWRCREKSPN